MPDALDLSNRQSVSSHRGFVLTQQQAHQLTPRRALVHAAWLVAVAASIDPDLPPFSQVLEAVKRCER